MSDSDTTWITLAQAAEISGLSHSHLRLLARQGKIKSQKLGRDWLTTEDAVRAYMATDRKPGPKPGKENGEGD